MGKIEEWIKEKDKLTRVYGVFGITCCENCGSRYMLSFHHRPKRSTQKAVHDFDHTRLLCAECHSFFEKNNFEDSMLFANSRGYHMKDKISTKNKNKPKKADWEKEHKCIHCKEQVSFLICPKCGHMSIKDS